MDDAVYKNRKITDEKINTNSHFYFTKTRLNRVYIARDSRAFESCL